MPRVQKFLASHLGFFERLRLLPPHCHEDLPDIGRADVRSPLRPVHY